MARSRPIDAASVRAYLARDWAAFERANDAHRASQRRRHGPGAGLQVSEQLRAQACAIHPGWPSAADREEDLQTHARVAALLARASTASAHATRPTARRRAPRVR